MTDLEISKALALAIGWTTVVKRNEDVLVEYTPHWRIFDYRDWLVIGPIAEKYKCFPEFYNDGWYAWVGSDKGLLADTPQKAIALAVIGAKK